MKDINILSIDTASKACSVALLANGKVEELVEIAPQMHAKLILKMIDKLLKQENLKLTDLTTLSFGEGPGAFTGVRIAAAVAQAIAFAHKIPLIAISNLEALAMQSYLKHNNYKNIIVANDARMNEVYFANYQIQNSYPVLINEQVVIKPNLARTTFTDNYLCVGDGFFEYSDFSFATNNKDNLLTTAKYILHLALRKYEQRDFISLENAQPNYLRNDILNLASK